MLFANKRHDRVGLLVAMVIFALVAIGQLWRLMAGVPVAVNGQTVSSALTMVIAVVAIVMAVWMGAIYRHNRPLL